MPEFFEGTIESNYDWGNGYFLLEIVVPKSAQFDPVPGQFVMLLPKSACEPFLPRPYSVMDFRKGVLTIFYKVFGKGTKALSELHEGDKLNLLGPLGNGFSPPEGKIAAVAGGIGIPPVFYYGSYYRSRGKLKDFSVFYGGKTGGDIFLLKEMSALGFDIYIATEDGSDGYKGLATELLERHLPPEWSGAGIIACGPSAMLKKVGEFSIGRKLKCEVSLEAFMGCGFGVCLGCAVETAGGDYARVCMEGPVFDCREVVP
ncbi:MAG: dihydroorotate dehydrogenase electron transfer subunit [Deltaproteobacteria bacterium]|nr:dihydroorotate dehydrogenase electron transfer subunit [Deltaproteobacteria bacterium]